MIHDVCLTGLPVVFAIDRGGLVGDDGPTHHGVFDLSYLRMIPNMVVMSPKDENELQHMLYTAVRHNGPVAVRYPRGNGVGVSLDWQLRELEPGKAEVLKEGEDVAILAIGQHVHTASLAAEELQGRGIKAKVVNMRFVKPVDEALIEDVARKTGKIVTIEENALIGGFGSAVLECLSDRGLTDVMVKRLGLPDRFVEHGSQQALRKRVGLDVDSVIKACEELVQNMTPREDKSVKLHTLPV